MNTDQNTGGAKKSSSRTSPQNMGAIQSALASALANSSTDGEHGDGEKIIKVMARIINEMGVSAAIQADPNDGDEDVKLPSLTKFEMDVITLVSSPNSWFIVNTTKKKPHNNKFISLGDCFDVTYRMFKGEYNTFVRYNGGMLNDTGRAILVEAQRKLDQIKSAVAVHGTRISGKKASGQTEVSLTHAGKYPLTDEERTFLALLEQPNMLVAISDHTKRPESWHGFRWKWQSRYGFDLSQIMITQNKQADGTFTVYGKYTPNAEGKMNDGLAAFVEFLNSKPQSVDMADAKSQGKKGVLGSILGSSR